VTAFGYLLKHQLVDSIDADDEVLGVYAQEGVALCGAQGRRIGWTVQEYGRGGPTAGRARGGRSRGPSREAYPAEATMTERIEAILTPVLAPLAKVLIVLVLVIFLLAKHEDCAIDSFALVGKGKLTLTTRTLDERAYVSAAFILHQSLINGGFGVVVALGLWAIGIPTRPCGGLSRRCSGLFPSWHVAGDVVPRGARLRAVRGLGADAGDTRPLHRTRHRDRIHRRAAGDRRQDRRVVHGDGGQRNLLDLDVGTVGLVLSTPMTVCLVVLGKHVTRLEFWRFFSATSRRWNPNSSCTSGYWRATRTKP